MSGAPHEPGTSPRLLPCCCKVEHGHCVVTSKSPREPTVQPGLRPRSLGEPSRPPACGRNLSGLPHATLHTTAACLQKAARAPQLPPREPCARDSCCGVAGCCHIWPPTGSCCVLLLPSFAGPQRVPCSRVFLWSGEIVVHQRMEV